MPKNTNDRVRRWLTRDGWVSQSVETWTRTARGPVSRDLFGGIDVVAMKVGEPAILGIQTTSFDHRWNRLEKLLSNPRMKLWVMTGCRLWVVSWKRERPEPYIYRVGLDEFREDR